MAESPVKQRVTLFLEAERVSIYKFEKSIGVSNGYFRQLRHRPSDKVIEKIESNYPTLNIVWLLTGDGTMYKNDTITEETKPTTTIDDSVIIQELRKQITEKDKEIAFLRSLVNTLTNQQPELPHVTNPATDMGIKYYEDMMREIKEMKEEIKKSI